MTPTFDKIHLRFKLNGINYNHEELKEVAYSLVKEGVPYEKIIGDFLLDWLDDNDYLIIKTSGSTGFPKPIKVSKQAMVNSSISTADFFEFEPGNTALHCLPTKYVAGKMMLVRAMILGLELDMVEPSSSPVFDYEKHYDFGAMVPFQLENSLKYCDKIKTIIIGGAPASFHLINKVQNSKANVYETFGMTETVSHIAVRKLNNFKRGQSFSNSYFRTLPSIEISQDKRGCLIINAPQISNEQIVTNDIVQLHSDKEFEWLGRIDNVINSGGIKIFPESVEKKIEDKLTSRFFVASKDHKKFGEKVILVIEGEEMEISTNYFENLDEYETPKEIYFLPKFSETVNGKIQRQQTLKLLK
ncbi:AMP-binding protein [Yeosuana sp. MJ-SS3]|uniref:AMP-binding protein n=1 Tax=Gilvirhabdus luticola TaxID=3079858 RepID=A0ABU3U762_9FLAO|nr:AMP-binding protein [Yeosuana sp. MJ-SS3]MDU8886220.1 AMP-binding protein [Yeosuana sp. MJ-SS3]